MDNVSDRQTFVISINCATFNPNGVKSTIILPMNLRFAADELVLKCISYHPAQAAVGVDRDDTIQIWCNVTNDGLIGSFSNFNNFTIRHDEHFRISNSFQTGNFILQLQRTEVKDIYGAAISVASYNPQVLISDFIGPAVQTTFGTVVITLEFLKLKNKSLY